MWTLIEAQICGKRVRPRRLPRPRRFPARLGDGVAPRWGRRGSRSRGTSLRPVGRHRAPPRPPIPGPPLRPQRLESRGVSAHGDDSCDVGSRVGRLWQGQLQESLRDQGRVSPASGPAAPPGRDAAKGDVCRPPRICGAPFHLLGKNDRFPPENSGGKSFEPCPDPNPAAHAETRGAAAGPSAGAQRAMRASATRARRPPFARPRHESGLPSSCRISFRF